MKLDRDSILRELQFNAVRSSGSGGQHVNKTASKVELQFNIETSQALNEEQKSRLLKKLSTRLTTDNRLILSSGDT
ncbi:MAG: peptide chain release factor-like protein, partial [Flavobacteriaceae bacterium]|nr:peptide chain release factor-like protein [Flavobacteriaceae bacterium]